MKNFSFGFLKFEIKDEKITLNGIPFIEVGIAGNNRDSHLGAKLICSSESFTLKFFSYAIKNDKLLIIQTNKFIEVITEFSKYDNTSSISICISTKNISSCPITLENASFIYGLNVNINDAKNIKFTRFIQSHHTECQPRTDNLFSLGLTESTNCCQYRVSHINVGSWSTKEALPQGILELPNGKFIFFQIESNNTWYYEISDHFKQLYLAIDGGNEAFGGWYKILKPSEIYHTEKFVLSCSNSVDNVIADITKYRRYIALKSKADDLLPIIFNEYMHLSWDSPCEENTKRYAQVAAKAGADYYVIDCGWHDEVDGNIIYPYVGRWLESKKRFPHGIRAITDYIRSLGMKAGLWLEPEIIGNKYDETLSCYDESCFVQRHNKRICVMGRYFLDYRNEKVRSYMTKTIYRMINDYGAQYIKFDYNQDMGLGTELNADSACDGLKLCSRAYLSWIDEIKESFPFVLFETCSSGGMRMDYETLKHFSIVSTSDQTSHLKYPFISANILAAVLPEQAAVWAYPVAGKDLKDIGKEDVIMNMINSFLGRMHLASDLSKLTVREFNLVKEGVEYSKSIAKLKNKALPYFPLGFADFSQKTLSAGFISEKKLYLALWNLSGEKNIKIHLKSDWSEITCSYPKTQSEVKYLLKDGELIINFTEDYQARFFEIW